MRHDKLTVKAQEALASARDLAISRRHPEVTPEHLLHALITQDGGSTITRSAETAWHLYSRSGSHDIAVDGLRVPLARSAAVIGASPRIAGALYAFPLFGLLAAAIAGVTLGIARGVAQHLVTNRELL